MPAGWAGVIMIEALGAGLALAGGLASLTAAGYGLLLALLPQPEDLTPTERVALGFGLGPLALSFWMLALSQLQIPFSLGAVAGPGLVPLGMALLAPSRRRLAAADAGRLGRLPRSLARQVRDCGRPGLAVLCGALLGVAFLYAGLRATLYPLWAWDALATWGLKAKVFYLHRAVYLGNIDAHNYYPNLTPLTLTYLYLWLGGVKDWLGQGLFPCWGAALLLLYGSLLRRLGVSWLGAWGAAAFVLWNGTTFIVHLYIAYADLALTYYTLAVAGLLLLRLAGRAPRGALLLIALGGAGMAWSKYEGWPLALIVLVAAYLTLLWLRPAGALREAVAWGGVLAAIFVSMLPWRLFVRGLGIDVGSDHLLGFFPEQLAQGLYYVGRALIWPPYFGLFWPAVGAALIWQGRTLWRSPQLFPALLLAGSLAATVLAYAVAPTSAAEFPLYVRATVDRLLLHVVPAVGLILAAPLRGEGDLVGGGGTAG